MTRKLLQETNLTQCSGRIISELFYEYAHKNKGLVTLSSDTSNMQTKGQRQGDQESIHPPFLPSFISVPLPFSYSKGSMTTSFIKALWYKEW